MLGYTTVVLHGHTDFETPVEGIRLLGDQKMFLK